MKFHYQGYVSGDPRVQQPSGSGLARPTDIPDKVDVLIVGAGPAGMITAAQLSQFPSVRTRIIDHHNGRLEVGRADGIQPRSLETFEAFGFADRLVAEACEVVETTFWQSDPAHPENIRRVSRVLEDPYGVSEYRHVTVNQARVLDYFGEVMANAPTRMTTNYGVEFEGLSRSRDGEYPISVQLAYGGNHGARARLVHAKYVVGADGAHSKVRKAIGCGFSGHASNHAWGVLDLLATTDFPDVRRKCVIQSRSEGSVLLIPREGGFLFRLYVDLGDITPECAPAVRATPAEAAVAKARRILVPYMLDVRQVARYSVYEVGHHICDRFDDASAAEESGARQVPRVFVAGDAAHTHSAQAGQGMNVSLQDGFNLGWKLAHVLTGRARDELLATYSAERSAIGRDIISFDERWSTAMAERMKDVRDHLGIEHAYLESTEFAQGFMTRYPPSMITASGEFQELARGFPIGKRFRSATATRVADGTVRHIGHEATADGRWRLYVFADRAPSASQSSTAEFTEHLPVLASSLMHAAGTNDVVRLNDWFDVKIIYQQRYSDIELGNVPGVFLPTVGPYELTDYANVYATSESDDIFEVRNIDRRGVAVLVRPDQYVASILPLSAKSQLERFLGNIVRAYVSRGRSGR